MKQSLFAILCWAAFSQTEAVAQDLHIYADAFTDSVYFMRNNKPVERASIRKGAQIVLHVQNYNSYLYNIELETDNETLNLSQGKFGKGFAAGSSGGNPFEMLLKTVGGGFPALPMLGGGILDDSNGFASAEGVEESKKVKKLEMELNRNLNGLQQTGSELATLEYEIKDILKTQKLTAFSIVEMNRLRYDPNLEPKQIRKLSQEYAAYVFKESDPEKLTLDYVLKKSDEPSKMDNMLSNYRKKVLRYERFQQNVLGIRNELMEFSFPQTNFNVFLDSTLQATETATEKLELYTQNLDRLEQHAEAQSVMDPSNMAALRSDYISFMANDFSKTYRQIAKGENLNLKIKLTPVDSATYLGARSKQLPPIPVKVYGGMRMTTSVGIGFSQYFERPKDYFVRDSIVSASEKDAFTPVLATFLHFFSPQRGTFSWGGSFGVGIPLGGETNLQSISFFLGPSVVIGQEQNIVFSGGLMGGKVKQPAQGYQVGDYFELDSSLFDTETKYALGYFLGVSFNILGK